jgi:lipid II:glycine glycyltransferase (peptidoglycan interpeptide bridge formation enzyme)
MKITDVKITEASNSDGLRRFYFECLQELKERTGMYLPPYSFFKVLLNILGPKKMVSLLLVEYDNEVLGGILALVYKDMAVMRYSAGKRKYRELYPQYILFWEQMKKFKSRGLKRIDLGGIPSDKSNGLYIFKSKWGGEIKNVDWYVKDVRFAWLRSLWRKYKARSA